MKNEQHIKAIGFMLICGLCISLIALFGKAMTEQLSIAPLIFIRFFVPAIGLAIVIIIRKQKFNFQPRFWRLYLIRASSMLLCQYCYFYYLRHNSLLSATLLLCTGPLFVPLIARIWPGIKLSLKTLSYIIIAFIGVILVLQPKLTVFNYEIIIGLGAGLFTAISQVAFHHASKTHTAAQISFIMCCSCAFIGGIIVLLDWHVNYLTEFGNLVHLTLFTSVIAFTVVSISNQLARGKAYSLIKNPGSINPFLYSGIIFALVLDIFIYQILPNFIALLGAVIMITCGTLIILQCKKRSN